ncbi:MAG: entericidin [Formosimonas sp.]
MRKLWVLAAVAVLGLSACNTFKGLANGVGKDISAVGNGVKKGGDYVQEKIPAPAPTAP